jgi:Spx/MgsR family transcriptional regulator
MLTIYGIPNCDVTKKARKWLEEQGISYTFHDYKTEGLSVEQMTQWLQQRDWAELLNARGTTWRELPAAAKEQVVDATSAAAIMLENLSMIKRPVVEREGKIVSIGFDAAKWQQFMG